MYSRPDILFWDVDTQIDFIHPDGKLNVPGAEEIVPNLERLTDAARRNAIPVVQSADDHEPEDGEISEDPNFESTYPPHCMRGSAGQERIPETRLPEVVTIGHRGMTDGEIRRLVADAPQAVLILKKRFDVFSNPNAAKVVSAIEPRKIVLYGVALDVCNRAALDGLWTRGYTDLALVTDAVKALDPERGEELLAEWRQRGVEMLTTDEVLARVEEPVPAE